MHPEFWLGLCYGAAACAIPLLFIVARDAQRRAVETLDRKIAIERDKMLRALREPFAWVWLDDGEWHFAKAWSGQPPASVTPLYTDGALAPCQRGECPDECPGPNRPSDLCGLPEWNRKLKHAHGVPGASLTEQLSRAVEASDEGHDPLCMAVLRGKACTCGVPDQETRK